MTDSQQQPQASPGTANEEPPPLTAFAWRNGLVRPAQGRVLAGVCGAFGRATNTDPVLWRVLVAVLSIFGGIGLLAYLLGWLLLPADGDTGSPVEALLGRGRSGTSTIMTVIGAVVVLLSIGAFLSEPFRPGPFGIVLLGAAVLLLLRDRRRTPVPAGSAPGEAPPMAATPPTPAQPFAPHGPYASSASEAPTGAPAATYASPYAVPPVPPIPPVRPVPSIPPPPPPPPKPKPPRSRLGGLTLSMVLLVLGGVAVVDLVGFSMPAAGYVAAALATVGLGLVVGAWLGRARGLIALGLVLVLVLGVASVVGRYRDGWQGGSVTWTPTSLEELESSYRQEAGDVRLDLTRIDFASVPQPVEVTARLEVGSLVIVLPPEVDVTVNADIEVGNAEVLGEEWNGFGLDRRTVTDYGSDGVGGGALRVNAEVDLGNLEVHR